MPVFAFVISQTQYRDLNGLPLILTADQSVQKLICRQPAPGQQPTE